MAATGLGSDELKRKAIDIAKEKIRTLGVERIRFSDVARELGITHAGLYGYFKNKDELLGTVLKDFISPVEIKLRKVAEKEMDGEELLFLWFETLYQEKRKKIIEDKNLYEGFTKIFDTSSEIAKDHVELLKDQIEIILKKIREDISSKEMANTIYLGTTAFHNPLIMQRTYEVDESKKLEVLLKSLLYGVLK